MKTLSKTAAKTFLKLVEGLKSGESKKIDNTEGVFMPVSVERLTETRYSVTHYFKQGGDLIPDPDMEFLVYPHAPDQIVPIAIQHSTGHYVRAYELNEKDIPERWDPRQARELASFANMWMKNIKDQQGL